MGAKMKKEKRFKANDRFLLESIIALKSGGTLGFTTWAHSGPFYLLQEAATLIPLAPNSRTIESSNFMLSKGYWHDRSFIRKTLEELEMKDIKIETYHTLHQADNGREFAKNTRIVVKVITSLWPKEIREKYGWEMFENIEKIMNERKIGDGDKVGIRSVVLVVTAKKP